MPTFRTAPSGNLTASIRRMVASGGANVGPLQEAAADQAAATTARNLSLAEKARAEVEAMHAAQAARNDPATRTEYAANVAGIDMPDATRLAGAIRGQMEQPGPADIDDAEAAGHAAQPYPMAKPNLQPGQERMFRSAIAAAIANNIATGKTNAEQLAHAGERTNEAALINEAANTPDAAAANPIIAAVAKKVREPFRLGGQGQVLNRETGDVNEDTDVAGANVDFTNARADTEGARQTELGTRSTKNTKLADLAAERAGAVKRGEANKGGARVSPQQVERWISEVARKEWDAVPPRDRKGMNFQQHLDKVRERFKAGPSGGEDRTTVDQDAKDALDAINAGAPAKAVHARFEKRWGVKLIDAVKDPSDTGLGAGADALDEED